MSKETKEKVNYNYEMQLLFVAMMITDFELFVRCQNILRPHFFDKALAPVVKFILEYSEKYSGVPSTEIIKSETNFDIAVLENVLDSQKEWFLDQIEKFCRHKAIETAILKSADMLEEGYYNDVEGLVREAVLVSLNRDLGTNYFEDPKTRLQKLVDQNGKITSGWKSIDKVIYNMSRGELVIFTAILGGGKSVALQNLTVNLAAQNYNVIYFTLELSEELVAKRLDAMVTDIPTASIYRNMDKVELMVKMKEKHMGAIQVKYVKAGTRTNDLKAYLKEYQIKNGKKPDMVVVDYLDLMYPNSNRVDLSNFFVKDKFVSEELRALAMEESIIVLTASQINRSGFDEMNPTAANIAGGLSKAMTADLVINVHNTIPQRERGEITFQFMKTRNSGGVGKHIVMKYDNDTLRISDMEEGAVSQSTSSIDSVLSTEESPVFDNTAVGQNELYKNAAIEQEKNSDLSPALSRLLNTTKNRD